jgi:hypothetical protein
LELRPIGEPQCWQRIALGLGAVVDRLHEDASSNDNRVAVKLIGESIRT